MDRLGFIRKLFLVDQGVEAVNALRGKRAAETEPVQRVVPFTFLRPPGAPLEPTFLARCTRCDLCRDACPEHIIIKATEPLMGRGTPIVDPSRAPCTECGECIEACPDQALLPGEDRRMGRAIWHAETCISAVSVTCTACVDACPEGAKAIEAIVTGGIAVHPEACTACGFCVRACPTDPKSLHLEGRPPVPLRGHPPVPVRHG